MTLWQAIVLGLIQGLTEFLPISSTAHLRIVPAALGWSDPGAAFTAVIQLGTLAAVLIYFARDIVGITRDTLTGRGQLGWMICAGTVPIVVVGLAFRKYIEHHWRSLYVIAGAMIGLALVLALAEWLERRRRRLREMNELGWLDAIVVGCFQAIALVPGSSRSGCTIAGGLFLGMKRDTAARFSFLLSLPAVFAAGVFELKELRHANVAGWTNTIVATVVAFVLGYASIAFLLGYLRRHTTWVFILYRLALGALLLAALAAGTLQPL
ncbi:MAG: undecaprenyl-diphosphatase UppP [Planctomycetes bacterium]|nr:undecaprenyl-diphosphatase UppP [Planctomycetota bacterium]MBM4080637.1 undecaprenyl-diphosphatase UppP [Planctomycetota bacterium]MBM4083741.1 undecaprenyl-diphosphatase UppP [Planctomycetota bacterium]